MNDLKKIPLQISEIMNWSNNFSMLIKVIKPKLLYTTVRSNMQHNSTLQHEGQAQQPTRNSWELWRRLLHALLLPIDNN